MIQGASFGSRSEALICQKPGCYNTKRSAHTLLSVLWFCHEEDFQLYFHICPIGRVLSLRILGLENI